MIEDVKSDPGLKDVRQRTVSPAWLAHYWDVHPNTIYRDIRKGALKAFRLPGGQYRVLLSEARRYGRPVE